MVLAGCILAFFGIRIALLLGVYLGLIPGVFGLLGILWVLLGARALALRSRLAIVIDEAGIELPAHGQAGRVRIPREEITAVSKHQSLKGRLIEITTTTGNVLVQARNYCELDDFISHCRTYEIPVA